MAYFEKRTITLAVSSGGALTTYTPVVNGVVTNLRYEPGTLGGSTAIVVSTETTGRTLFSKTVGNTAANFPNLTQDTTDATGTADTSTRAENKIASERIKIVVSNGGTSTTGSLIVEIEGTFSGA